MQSDIKLRLLESVMDKQYDAQRAAYIEKAKRGFDRHNAVMFLAYSGLLIWNKRKPELIYFCWFVSALSVIDMVCAHMDMKEEAKELLNVCYIFLLQAALLFGKTVYHNELSMTVLVCSAVTTSVLGIKVYTYVKVLLAAVLLDGFLYILVAPLFLEYETRSLILIENVLLCAFLAGYAVVFENLHCEMWKRETEQEKQNNRDQLTDLYNRRYAEKYYENELDENKLYAVCYIDLDNFKMVNDVLGHNSGDDVLLETANLLKQAFGAAGIVARLGGDEFLAIISVLDVRSLIKMVQGFLNGYPRVIEEAVKVSVSIGIALRPVGSIKTYGEICKEADAAMYEAKRFGKGKAFLSACCLTKEIEITKEEKWNETEGTY